MAFVIKLGACYVTSFEVNPTSPSVTSGPISIAQQYPTQEAAQADADQLIQYQYSPSVVEVD
jgi:hypothetical protein